MKINVTENKVSIKEEQILNENEYNIHKIQFDFSSEYTDDLVKVALFSIDNHTYKKIISNNECDIPPEVLTQRGYSILGVYAYKTEQDTLALRYSPSPTRISVYDGSYKAEAENSEPITPSEIEQYQQILQNSLQNFQNEFNTLAQNTETSITEIEEELQRKVDEGYFDGEDGFSPIANVIQLSNGVKIEIEDKNGKTTADVLNGADGKDGENGQDGQDGYTPQRGIDYWTEEDKQEVEEEATQQIEGKIEEYNENAAEKLNQYNQNSVQKTNDYNTNAEQKMSAYNTNANQKVESFNTNASSKLSEYNSNAEQKETSYNTNASQKLETFNTNATSKLTEYNTNHTEKMSVYNSNTTQKLNAFNENATQKTEDFDEHTEEIQESIENLQAENERLRNTLPTTTGTGQAITLNKTAELEFKKPPLPMGNSEQVQYSGKQLIPFTNQDFTLNGVRHYVQNGTLYLNGTTTTETNQRNELYKSNFSMTLPAGTYYFKRGTSNIPMYIIKYDDNTNIVTNEGQFTLEETTQVYFGIYLYQRTLNNEKIDCQLELGNSATSYEPYTYGQAPNPNFEVPITNVTGDVEVVVGNKNLFDISKSSLGKILNMSNGSINGGTSATDTSNYIEVNSGTTDVLKGVSSETIYYWNYYICLYDSNKDFVERQAMTSLGSKAFSFIPSQNGFIRFTYNNNSSELQLEKGSSATTYVAHKEQKFIFPLGNERLMTGSLLTDNGKQHTRMQKIFDGSESWYAYTDKNTQSYYCYYTNAPSDCIAAQEEADLVKCNILPESTWDDIYGKRHDTPIIALRNNKRFYVRVPFATLVEWEAYITQQYTNETPVKVEYKLEQISTIPYTSAQQTAYNQIKQALSHEGQTNITGSSNENNPIFNVEAYLDSKIILAEKVDKVEGKGLSTNDFTNTYKNNVDSNTSARHTHTNKTVLDGIASSDITNWNGKQNETDNSLNTTNKTITGAINEVYSIARGANQAKSYIGYSEMITALNSLDDDVYISGQIINIETLLIPDLWVYSVESTNVPYTYTTDEAFTTALSTNGYVQVGYYKLSALETQKVDLTDYEQNTNKTTTISSSSTNAQYPSAKAVYDLFNSIIDGDEVSY